jgi:hypothetical protein
MNELTAGTALVTALILITGAGLTYVAVRAYRRTGATALRSLAVGFGAITLGGSLGGLDWLPTADPTLVRFGGNALIATGLVCLLYALYTRDERLESTGSHHP